MKKLVFITILSILLICSVVGIWILITPKEDSTTLTQDNAMNENTIDDSANTISDEIQPETNSIVTESEPEVEIKTEVEKETSKQDNTVVEKNASTTTSTSTTSANKTTSTSKNAQSNNTQSTNNTTTKSTNSSSNVQNTQSTEESTSEVVEKTTEKPSTIQPTRCTNNNNHSMDVGNCGEWFNTKSEAIAYYNEKITYWGGLWESYKIEDDEYYKNCPTGYEIWNCIYCSKWTINLYYR